MRLFSTTIFLTLLLGAAPAFAATLSSPGTLSGAKVVTVPSASPAAGTYTSAQSVALSAPGADEIDYTLDGTDPACWSGDQAYAGPIDASTTVTVKAVSCYASEEMQSDIATFTYTINISAPAPQNSGGGGGGGGGGSNGPPVGTYGGGGGGSVLGASTTTVPQSPPAATTTVPQASSTPATTSASSTTQTCGPLITHYLHIGWADNDVHDVKALQQFLDGNLGLSLPVTGFYGQATFDAVEEFQIKYWQEVLLPWVPYGLPTDHTPTGFVYKTTKREINDLYCPALRIPVPELP